MTQHPALDGVTLADLAAAYFRVGSTAHVSVGVIGELDHVRRSGMNMATAERRQAAVFVGLPAPGEIGRSEIMEALRRAGARADLRRRQAAQAVLAERATSPCKDRMHFE